MKIENHDVRVMALDGQPSEPFLARNGAVVLAPGGRADVFIDAARARRPNAPILLHDGKRGARRSPDWSTSDEPPVRAAPLPARLPLPSNGLPEQLDLKSALRVDLPFGADRQADWLTPADLPRRQRPRSGSKRGRTVVLALTNRAATPPCFICMAIISGCSTGSTMAGSRSGSIPWRSSRARPSASPLPPTMPGAG